MLRGHMLPIRVKTKRNKREKERERERRHKKIADLRKQLNHQIPDAKAKAQAKASSSLLLLLLSCVSRGSPKFASFWLLWLLLAPAFGGSIWPVDVVQQERERNCSQVPAGTRPLMSHTKNNTHTQTRGTPKYSTKVLLPPVSYCVCLACSKYTRSSLESTDLMSTVYNRQSTRPSTVGVSGQSQRLLGPLVVSIFSSTTQRRGRRRKRNDKHHHSMAHHRSNCLKIKLHHGEEKERERGHGVLEVKKEKLSLAFHANYWSGMSNILLFRGQGTHNLARVVSVRKSAFSLSPS